MPSVDTRTGLPEYRPKSENWQRRKLGEPAAEDFSAFTGPAQNTGLTRRASPSAPPVVGGPETRAVVKWFNGEKGFGFVELAAGGHVFLHVSVLARLGVTTVSPGTTLRLRVGQGQKGPQVTDVLAIDESTASPLATGVSLGFGERGRGGFGLPRRRDLESTPPSGSEHPGVVKWYNAAKGFGFIAP